MFSQNIGLLGALVMVIIGAGITWSIAVKFPCREVRKRIERDAVRSRIGRWYGTRKWKCVEVIPNHMGMFGKPTRAVILESESGDERIKINSATVAQGKKYKMRLRTDDEMKYGLWLGVVDEFMTPEPL